jgi:CBS domain-containing protein
MRHADAGNGSCRRSAAVGASNDGSRGPIVHLGATLGSYVAKRLHLSLSLAQTLLGCGVAAAIASAINAPIAGVFFARIRPDRGGRVPRAWLRCERLRPARHGRLRRLLGAPISTVIMIFETTGDYGVTFAVMIAVAIASVLCRQIYGHSYFIWQLAERGIDLQARRDHSLLRTRRLSEVMRPQVVTVGPDADMEQLKGLFLHRHLPIFVVDENGRLYGSIAFQDLADAAFDPARERAATARDLVHRTPVALVPEDDLETALRLCEMNDEEHMPVVDNGHDMRVIGEVRYQDLVLAYNRALLAARAAERGES